MSNEHQVKNFAAYIDDVEIFNKDTKVTVYETKYGNFFALVENGFKIHIPITEKKFDQLIDYGVKNKPYENPLINRRK